MRIATATRRRYERRPTDVVSGVERKMMWKGYKKVAKEGSETIVAHFILLPDYFATITTLTPCGRCSLASLPWPHFHLEWV